MCYIFYQPVTFSNSPGLVLHQGHPPAPELSQPLLGGGFEWTSATAWISRLSHWHWTPGRETPQVLLKAKKGLWLEFMKSETKRCPLVSKLGLELNCLESPEVVKDPGPPNRSWTFSATGPPELGGRRRSRARAFAARLLRRLLHMLWKRTVQTLAFRVPQFHTIPRFFIEAPFKEDDGSLSKIM